MPIKPRGTITQSVPDTTQSEREVCVMEGPGFSRPIRPSKQALALAAYEFLPELETPSFLKRSRACSASGECG